MPRRSCSIPGLPCARLGRPCVVGAVQVAPTPRIRPREVPRHGGSEAHGASNSRPSNLKLALVAYWYGLALCPESSRRIWHIRIVNARPGARTRSKHRAASAGLLATAGEPASDVLLMPCIRDARVQQAAAQACVWNAAADGTCVRHHRNRCDLNEAAAPDGFRLQLAAMLRVYPASPLTRGRGDVRGRPR